MNDAINPLDGRYYEKTRALAPYFSESALMKYRIMMECEFLICLSQSRITGLRKFTPNEVKKLRALYEKFNDASYKRIKFFEKTTNHDVKAVEYFIKENLKNTSLKNTLEWVHFGLTSEDTNNCAYALMLASGVKNVILPVLSDIQKNIKSSAKQYAKVSMLARTHGQSASPTTLGKEFAVFSDRLRRQIFFLNKFKIDEYIEPGVIIHSKIVLVDDKVSFIGSVNFNKRSFIHDTENFVMIYNSEYNKKMHTVLDTYLKKTKEVTKKQKVALWKRIIINVFDEEF